MTEIMRLFSEFYLAFHNNQVRRTRLTTISND